MRDIEIVIPLSELSWWSLKRRARRFAQRRGWIAADPPVSIEDLERKMAESMEAMHASLINTQFSYVTDQTPGAQQYDPAIWPYPYGLGFRVTKGERRDA